LKNNDYDCDFDENKQFNSTILSTNITCSPGLTSVVENIYKNSNTWKYSQQSCSKSVVNGNIVYDEKGNNILIRYAVVNLVDHQTQKELLSSSRGTLELDGVMVELIQGFEKKKVMKSDSQIGDEEEKNKKMALFPEKCNDGVNNRMSLSNNYYDSNKAYSSLTPNLNNTNINISYSPSSSSLTSSSIPNNNSFCGTSGGDPNSPYHYRNKELSFGINDQMVVNMKNNNNNNGCENKFNNYDNNDDSCSGNVVNNKNNQSHNFHREFREFVPRYLTQQKDNDNKSTNNDVSSNDNENEKTDNNNENLGNALKISSKPYVPHKRINVVKEDHPYRYSQKENVSSAVTATKADLLISNSSSQSVVDSSNRPFISSFVSSSSSPSSISTPLSSLLYPSSKPKNISSTLYGPNSSSSSESPSFGSSYLSPSSYFPSPPLLSSSSSTTENKLSLIPESSGGEKFQSCLSSSLVGTDEVDSLLLSSLSQEDSSRILVNNNKNDDNNRIDGVDALLLSSLTQDSNKILVDNNRSDDNNNDTSGIFFDYTNFPILDFDSDFGRFLNMEGMDIDGSEENCSCDVSNGDCLIDNLVGTVNSRINVNNGDVVDNVGMMDMKIRMDDNIVVNKNGNNNNIVSDIANKNNNV
jgi:hypothetical protein